MSSFRAQISAERVAGGEISVRQRDSIVFKHKASVGSRELAEEFGCSKRAINKTIQRFKSTNSNQSRPRSGQPPKISCQEKRYLFRLAKQQPKIEYGQMQEELG
jgi:transposase